MQLMWCIATRSVESNATCSSAEYCMDGNRNIFLFMKRPDCDRFSVAWSSANYAVFYIPFFFIDSIICSLSGPQHSYGLSCMGVFLSPFSSSPRVSSWASITNLPTRNCVFVQLSPLSRVRSCIAITQPLRRWRHKWEGGHSVGICTINLPSWSTKPFELTYHAYTRRALQHSLCATILDILLLPRTH